MLKRLVLVCVLMLATAAAIFFGGRSYRTLVLLNAAQDTGMVETSSIRAWMTVDYLVATYAVPGEEFRARLGVPLQALPAP